MLKKFDLVIIGAHNGSTTEELIPKQKNNVLLIEPVAYNLQLLKHKFNNLDNVFIDNVAISNERSQKKFYFVKESSIKKLGKKWASGLGSFNKKHILDHYSARFMINEKDIEETNIKTLAFNNLI